MPRRIEKSASAEGIRHYQVGEQWLPVVRTSRKKSIGLKPKAQGVELHVPRHLSERALQKVLDQHASWIGRKLETLSLTPVSPFYALSGEAVRFQGQTYRLLWQTGDRFMAELVNQDRLLQGEGSDDNRTDSADSESSGLLRFTLDETMLSPEGTLEAQSMQPVRQRVLQEWFSEQARHYFESEVLVWAQRIGVDYASITVKGYKSRWGSCYPDGRIQFNWRLLQAPAWVIDYVIVHELCHRVHANHSAHFWALVAHHYPQTQQAKRWLRQQGPELIGFLQTS
ncbi:SprT family zinc-dependent metalloprotease [Thiomicrorhabdus sp. zzn3]|uniref:M48 family metallopeptidase n=1 Tax=Thiomicrorhabdus sp. zzn3 TaxID=3039775 RepID=UPI0024369254|nr:SprT family zinc-dependent metalloprotease [Thiomicrorhabdus sp. zzn3]MDG6778530.1 SprT family zinc-dependent metalloprotease [Thiomicrorhabdus sp. zzn3]